MQRVVKRFFYAAIPVVALTMVIFAIAITRTLTRQPAPTPTPTAPMAPIEVQEVTVISHPVLPADTTRTVDIVAKLYNPNARAGVKSYPLTFTLLNARGEQIAEYSTDAYLLPGSVQYVPALNISFASGQQVGRVEVQPPADTVFARLPATVELPRFSLFLRDRNVQETGGRSTVVQRGIVRNTSTFDWQRVEVRAVALNATGDIVGVGQTFVGRLLVGEQREFTLQWPKTSEEIAQVVAIPSTNVFEEENVVEIIGDPSRLR